MDKQSELLREKVNLTNFIRLFKVTEYGKTEFIVTSVAYRATFDNLEDAEKRFNDMLYESFVKNKIVKAERTGFDIQESELSPCLFPHQKDTVRWAISGGRRAVFASFGLGKSLIQLEIIRLITKHKGGRALIICPLGVKQEFQRDSKMLDMTTPQYVRNNEEILASDNSFFITNYERVRDGGIDVNLFTVVTLDEASVLRGFGTKTYQTFLPIFKDVPYRFVCTATPSPNRHKELIHYAGFLGVMDTGQALTRFFQRNSEKAGDLQLHPHKEGEFWLWMATWSVFIQKPSDLGYSDKGYDLPELKVFWHEIKVDHTGAGFDKRNNQGKMFKDATISLPAAAKEKRETAPARLEKAIEIINAIDPSEHWLLWHHLEYERDLIQKAIPESKTIYGSQKDEVKEDLLIGFTNGDYRILATKPEIAGSGCNFQKHCNKAIYMGVNYQFNDFIQSVHRIHRFQQPNQCEIHIIYAESEREIVKSLQGKWKQHNELTQKMSELIQEHGLSANVTKSLERKINIDRAENKGDLYTWVNNDCRDEMAAMPENSVSCMGSVGLRSTTLSN